MGLIRNHLYSNVSVLLGKIVSRVSITNSIFYTIVVLMILGITTPIAMEYSLIFKSGINKFFNTIIVKQRINKISKSAGFYSCLSNNGFKFIEN